VIGTYDPDLSAFRDRGGKVVLWHGWADQLITPRGTIDYYMRLVPQMGGMENTAQFLRFFLAPGVAHCGGGAGPAPYGQLDALVSWVEDRKAPVTLTAARRDQTGTITGSRPLCQYPQVAKYKGSGSTDDAANFVCSTGF
jgi:hypothetical protein